jgi:hypothetical protein
MGFFYGRPCSSYLDELESTAVHLDDNLKQKKQCELLASNCTWELIMILASVCDDSSLKSDVSSAKWAVVQDLVNFKDKSFLPCASKRK